MTSKKYCSKHIPGQRSPIGSPFSLQLLYPRMSYVGVQPPNFSACFARSNRQYLYPNSENCGTTPRNIYRLSSRDMHFRQKTAVLHFRVPSGDLGATYDDHLRLIGKHVADFLIPISIN